MLDMEPRMAGEVAGVTGARRPRLLIVDPGRRFGCSADRQFSDLAARAFADGGFEVVWVIDADDPLPDPGFAKLRRLLPAGDSEAGPPQQASPTHRIARLDFWARAAWKAPHSSPPVMTAALLAWTSVRVLYRLKYGTGLVLHCCSRALGLFARLCARVLDRVPVGWRAARLGWRLAVAARQCLLKIAEPVRARRARQSAAAGEGAASPHAQLVELVKSLGVADAMLLPSARPPQLDMLLQLLPRLDLLRPLPTTLHVCFAEGEGTAGALGEDEGATLAARLKSGSPIRTVVFHAQTGPQCRTLERSLGLRVHEPQGGASLAALRRRFAPARGTAAAAEEGVDVPPSLVVERFGPLALLITALWGRVGSSTIFDTQTRYLVERGFIVARILIDHYPERGAGRAKRLDRLLAQNFENVRPHLHVLAERDDSFGSVWRLRGTREFGECSPVGRIGMLLAKPTIDDPVAVAWCAGRAVLTVVNHLPHVAFAERLAQAPIVLETHDIYAKLLTTHGVPAFVPTNPDGGERREADEADVWRRVAACVNLAPRDHAVVARVARHAALARPYVHRRALDTRDWPDVVAANGLPAELCTTSQFDIMLWGDWHDGNVAGVRWFLERVAEEHASLRRAGILLVGRVAELLPRRLLARPGLYATGFVDRIDDFFARSAVLVVPDRPGSTGTSIKVIDALARGCCFASTATGLRGVDLGDTGLAPSDDPGALALDVARLLESPETRRTRATVARRLYELNFSKAAYSRAWDEVLAEVLRRAPGAPAFGAHVHAGSAAALRPGDLAAGERVTDRRLFPEPNKATPVPSWP